MTSLYLIRHAQAQGNVEKRFQGRTDTPLTQEGKEQIIHLARRMKCIPLSAVYSSPLQRAWQTALGITASRGTHPVRCDGVVEIDGGPMENQRFEDLHQLYPVEFPLFLQQPHAFLGVDGGESVPEVYTRMRDTILDLVELHRGHNFAVVSHGAAIRCFLCFAYQLPLEQMSQVPWGGNTGVTHITFDHSMAPLVHHPFDTSHLTKL